MPLTIGVISDTHVYARGARRLPPEVIDLFIRFEVGLILHGGDVNTSGVLLALAEVAPVLAVRGNNDDAILLDGLPEVIEFYAGQHRFGLVHGHGGRSARSEARRRLRGGERWARRIAMSSRPCALSAETIRSVTKAA